MTPTLDQLKQQCDLMREWLAAKEKGQPFEVETRLRGDHDWRPCGKPMWNFQDSEYRRKPEPPKPVAGWVNVYATGVGYVFYTSKSAADLDLAPNRIDCVYVRQTEPPKEGQ